PRGVSSSGLVATLGAESAPRSSPASMKPGWARLQDAAGKRGFRWGRLPRVRRLHRLRDLLLVALAPLVVTTGCGAGSTPAAAPPLAPPGSAPASAGSAARAPGQAAPPAARPAWIERSDENARILLAVETDFTPERASSLGVESADERAIDLAEGFR